MILHNETVFSNVPLAFDFVIDEETGETRHYEALPFNLDTLIKLEDTMETCTIFWDEISLDASSREGQSVKNRLIGGAITLMGKMDISIVATLQFMRLLHVDLRDQMDSEIECFDKSFVYPNLQRGEMVSQELKDISGRHSGRLYERTGQIYSRLLMGKPFWGIYPTKYRFDIFAKATKYEMKRPKKVVSADGSMQEDKPDPKQLEHKKVYHLTAELGNIGDRFDKHDLRKYCRDNGVDLDDIELGTALGTAGWKLKTKNKYVKVF